MGWISFRRGSSRVRFLVRCYLRFQWDVSVNAWVLREQRKRGLAWEWSGVKSGHVWRRDCRGSCDPGRSGYRWSPGDGHQVTDGERLAQWPRVRAGALCGGTGSRGNHTRHSRCPWGPCGYGDGAEWVNLDTFRKRKSAGLGWNAIKQSRVRC